MPVKHSIAISKIVFLQFRWLHKTCGGAGFDPWSPSLDMYKTFFFFVSVVLCNQSSQQTGSGSARMSFLFVLVRLWKQRLLLGWLLRDFNFSHIHERVCCPVVTLVGVVWKEKKIVNLAVQ